MRRTTHPPPGSARGRGEDGYDGTSQAAMRHGRRIRLDVPSSSRRSLIQTDETSKPTASASRYKADADAVPACRAPATRFQSPLHSREWAHAEHALPCTHADADAHVSVTTDEICQLRLRGHRALTRLIHRRVGRRRRRRCRRASWQEGWLPRSVRRGQSPPWSPVAPRVRSTRDAHMRTRTHRIAKEVPYIRSPWRPVAESRPSIHRNFKLQHCQNNTFFVPHTGRHTGSLPREEAALLDFPCSTTAPRLASLRLQPLQTSTPAAAARATRFHTDLGVRPRRRGRMILCVP